MPATSNDGWWTTKKRGRDDDAIERDRSEVIARRKEQKRRLSAAAMVPVLAPPAATITITTKRTNKSIVHGAGTESRTGRYKSGGRVDANSKNNSNREPSPKRRRWANGPYSRRELFPEKESEAANARAFAGIRTTECRKRTKSRHRTLNHDGNRLGEQRGETKLVATPAPRERRKRKATTTPNPIVTPEPKGEGRPGSDNCKGEERLRVTHRTNRNRRERNGNSRVLLFGGSGEAGPSGTVPGGSSGRRRSQKTDRSSMAFRKRKQERGGKLRPEPDFARSAKCLAECISLRRKQQRLAAGMQRGNQHRGAASTGGWRRWDPYPQRRRRCSRSSSGGGTIAGKPGRDSNPRFDFVRQLLLAGASRNRGCKNSEKNTGDDSNRPGVGTVVAEMRAPRDEETRKPNFSAATTTKANTTLPRDHHNKTTTHLLSSAGKQEREVSKQQPDAPARRQETPHAGATPEIRAAMVEEEGTTKECPSREEVTGCADTNDAVLPQPGSDGKLFVSSQLTPSTASSAVLSLPTMDPYPSGSSLASASPVGSGGARSDAGNGEESATAERPRNENHPGGSTSGSIEAGEPPVTTAKNGKKADDEDPVRDAGFWKRLVDVEDAKAGGNSSTFKHALASLVLAKNPDAATNVCSATKAGDKNTGSGDFLWLPVLLEGGLNRTGLFERNDETVDGNNGDPSNGDGLLR